MLALLPSYILLLAYYHKEITLLEMLTNQSKLPAVGSHVALLNKQHENRI